MPIRMSQMCSYAFQMHNYRAESGGEPNLRGAVLSSGIRLVEFLWFGGKIGLTQRSSLLKSKVSMPIREESARMKTYMAKMQEVERKWVLVDAEGAVLGRLAAKIAPILMGKHRPTYTPNADNGDFVVVVNADKVRLTGSKEQTKEYDWYTGYPGGHKIRSYQKQKQMRPEEVIELAVRRMLPKTRIARDMFRRLKVYPGPEHQHQAQKPEKIEL
jgi:large subunit ribosomal protein L13